MNARIESADLAPVLTGTYTRKSGLRRTYEYAVSSSSIEPYVTWSATVWCVSPTVTKGVPTGVFRHHPQRLIADELVAAIERAIEDLDSVDE
jgi:hypothetical protein